MTAETIAKALTAFPILSKHWPHFANEFKHAVYKDGDAQAFGAAPGNQLSAESGVVVIAGDRR